MKRYALWLTMILLLITGTVQSDVPVHDPLGMAKMVEQIKLLTDQLNAMKEQLDTAKRQLEQISGITEHAKVVGLPPIPGLADYQDLTAWLDGLRGKVDNLRAEKEFFSIDDLWGKGEDGQTKQASELYVRRSDFIYGYMAIADALREAFSGRMDHIKMYRDSAPTANTLKAALDLNNRLATERLASLNDVGFLLAIMLQASMEKESIDHNMGAIISYRPTSRPSEVGKTETSTEK